MSIGAFELERKKNYILRSRKGRSIIRHIIVYWRKLYFVEKGKRRKERWTIILDLPSGLKMKFLEWVSNSSAAFVNNQ